MGNAQRRYFRKNRSAICKSPLRYKKITQAELSQKLLQKKIALIMFFIIKANFLFYVFILR